MTSDQFETLRLYLVVLVVLFRLAMMPRYLQSYLNMAYHKMEELKQETGKVTNIDLQKLIARVFYYLCVVSTYKVLSGKRRGKAPFQVTLQYVAPLAMILFLGLMYKTMGGGSWTGFWASPESLHGGEQGQAQQTPITIELEPTIKKMIEEQPENVQAITTQFSLAWQSLKHVRPRANGYHMMS